MNADIFTVLFLLMTFFSFTGWYMAEADNEILRAELSAYADREVRK